jgi:hypothetical protein
MDLKGNRIAGGLYRIIKNGMPSFEDEAKLSLTNVSLNVEIVDTQVLLEVRQTFNNQFSEACDVW